MGRICWYFLGFYCIYIYFCIGYQFLIFYFIWGDFFLYKMFHLDKKTVWIPMKLCSVDVQLNQFTIKSNWLYYIFKNHNIFVIYIVLPCTPRFVFCLWRIISIFYLPNDHIKVPRNKKKKKGWMSFEFQLNWINFFY